MLKAPKRLTKKEIKQDKLVTVYFQTQEFMRENGQTILFSAAGLILVASMAMWFVRWNANKEQEAAVELSKAKIEYFANDYNSAIPLLQLVVNSYGSTDAGKEAHFYLANAQYNLGNYLEAEQNYKAYLDGGKDQILRASATAGMAACLEQQKNYRAAAQLYKEAGEKYSKIFLAPDALFNAARCYLLNEDKSSARDLLTKLITDYPTANIKSDAEILLAELM